MKFLLALISFLAITQPAHTSYARPVTVTDAKVFICVSSGAKVYHKIKDCRGLHACYAYHKKSNRKRSDKRLCTQGLQSVLLVIFVDQAQAMHKAFLAQFILSEVEGHTCTFATVNSNS